MVRKIYGGKAMKTIFDMFKAHEQKNREIDRVVISNCYMLLQAGFCYHENYMKAIKTAHRLGLDKKEDIKVIEFI